MHLLTLCCLLGPDIHDIKDSPIPCISLNRCQDHVCRITAQCQRRLHPSVTLRPQNGAFAKRIEFLLFWVFLLPMWCFRSHHLQCHHSQPQRQHAALPLLLQSNNKSHTCAVGSERQSRRVLMSRDLNDVRHRCRHHSLRRRCSVSPCSLMKLQDGDSRHTQAGKEGFTAEMSGSDERTGAFSRWKRGGLLTSCVGWERAYVRDAHLSPPTTCFSPALHFLT